MTQADCVLINGNIITMDPLRPRAEALAMRGGRVLAVGATSEIRALAGRGARVIDAGGRMVLPGFQDTHIHMQDSGFEHARGVDLEAARSISELQRLIRDFAAKHTGSWVNGTGWYTGIFHDANLTKKELDAAVPDRPCFIYASDGHNACLNSLGVAAAGITRDTPDPPNGHIVKDAGGEPTGMLHEDAIYWVRQFMPEPTDSDYEDGVRYGQALCNRHGFTSVLDAMVKERHVRVYGKMAAEAALTVRVASTAKIDPDESVKGALERVLAMREAHSDGMFKVHSAKFFLDGVFENRTAAMIAPYSDAVGGNAPLMFPPQLINDMFTAFDAARFQIHVHVIGDLALRASLDGLEMALRANGPWPSLHQIAHVQALDPRDAPRFHQLGAMMNIQPLWARHEASTDDVALPMMGPERGKLMYAFRTLIDAGADYALSSDWGVSTLNPFKIMETAVTRQLPAKKGKHPVFLPEQRMTRAECLKGYTVNAARAAWRGADTGALSPGMLADVIILDRDILACGDYELGDTSVLLTLLGGAEVWRDPSFAG